ncbi:MAG: DUF4159 domain-containing protein [Porticoccaceae bacterium]|jgi:hypothetical protein|nr:DUF4159 domain-containing protein [Porticoccaceae bacterium]
MSRLQYILIFAIWVAFGSFIQPVQAQFFGGSFRSTAQNSPPNTELVVARLRFNSNSFSNYPGWSHNYPGSDRHLNSFLERSTSIDVEEFSFQIVDLSDEKIFDFPFVYLSEPGEMLLSEIEVRHLREYILRGGTIIMDDFDGTRQWDQMESQVRRAFPERVFVPIDENHIVFRAHETLENLQAMSQYVPGGGITYYGIYTDDGRLAIMAGHNNDLANFWDWYGDGSMPLKPSTDAFRLGTNAVIYSMTH